MNDFSLENHKSKCRVCFRELDKSIRSVDLNESHQTFFQLFTELELKRSSSYSNVLCIMCDFELRKCIKFRATALERQLKLYELFPLTDTCESDEDDNDTKEDIGIEKILNFSMENPRRAPRKQQLACYRSKFILEQKNPFMVVVEETPNVVKESVFLAERTKDAEGIEFKIEDDEYSDGKCLVNVIPPRKHVVRSQQFTMKIAKIQSLGEINKKVENKKRKRKKRLGTFKCDLCDFDSQSKLEIRKHINRHLRLRKANRKKYSCDFCGLERWSKEQMIEHLEREVQKKNKEYICSICEKNFKKRRAMLAHKKRHIRGNFFCDLCTRSYYTKQNLRVHILEQHMNVEPTLLCHFCSRTFVTYKALSNHLNTHKNTQAGSSQTRRRRRRGYKEDSVNAEGKFMCRSCDAEYSLKVLLRYHEQAHHQGLRYSCVYPNCTSKFCFKKDIRGHLIRTHGVIGENEMMTYKKLLKDHKPHTIELIGGNSWKKRNKREKSQDQE